MEKVFIYSPYSHWGNDATVANFITAIFKHKDYDVNILNCSGILNMCAIRNPYFAGGLAEIPKDRVCAECRSRQERYRFLEPQDFHTIEDYVDMQSCLAKAKEIQEEKCIESLFEIKFEGLRLYDQIQSSLNTYFRSPNLKFDTEKSISILKIHLIDSVLSISAAKHFFAQHKFDYYIIRNGRLNTTRCFAAYLESINIEYVTLDRIAKWGTKGGLSLVRNAASIEQLNYRQKYLDFFGQFAVPSHQLNDMKTFFDPDVSANTSANQFKATAINSQSISERFDLTIPIVVFAPSSTDEINTVLKKYFEEPDPNMQPNLIRQACEEFAEQDSLQLVVRAHPNAGSSKSMGKCEADLDFFITLSKQYKDHKFVHIVMPQDELNTRELCHRAQALVTFGTSLAFELPCLGIPVVDALGAYMKKHTFIYHFTHGNLIRFINSVFSQLDEERREFMAGKAIRTLYIQKAIYNFNCSVIDWAHWGDGKLLADAPESIYHYDTKESERIMGHITTGKDPIFQDTAYEEDQAYENERELYHELRQTYVVLPQK